MPLPSSCRRPRPSSTRSSCAAEWICQFVRAPASKRMRDMFMFLVALTSILPVMREAIPPPRPPPAGACPGAGCCAAAAANIDQTPTVTRLVRTTLLRVMCALCHFDLILRTLYLRPETFDLTFDL